MHGLVKRAGPVPVCGELRVRVERGAGRVALVNVARQRFQRFPVVMVVLGPGAGRGRDETPCGEGGARACGKHEARLQP